jgi:CheY-like chemotaxis protein
MIYFSNVLLIDDDHDDHEFFLEAVREIDSSIRCNSMFDSEEALKFLKDQKQPLPDLIVLDTNMPKLNGYQILTELKNDPALNKIPVVMYSTFFSERDSDEFTKLGAANYLAKPSKLGDFRNLLSEILTKKY